jgi:phage shock protein A
MENNPIKFDGMSAAAAKEYILGLIATVKLTEKEIHSLEEEAAKWRGRVELARS